MYENESDKKFFYFFGTTHWALAVPCTTRKILVLIKFHKRQKGYN